MLIGKNLFDKSTLLCWSDNFSIDIQKSKLYVRTSTRAVRCLPETIELISILSTPRTIGDALEALNIKDKGKWIQLTANLAQLVEIGAVSRFDKDELIVDAETTGFASPAAHISMLNDENRTKKYLEAISEVVNSGDVVIDLGSGTGILSIAAVKAGAAKVFALEETSIGHCARTLISSNHVADRIQLVKGRSTEINIPERANVLVSEIIGAEPLDESILQSTLDARRRMLTENARYIPHRIRIFGQLLQLDEQFLERHQFRRLTLEKWTEAYDIDFSALLNTSYRNNYRITAAGDDIRRAKPLSEPTLLADIDLTQLNSDTIDNKVRFAINSDGNANGAVVHFEAYLTGHQKLSNQFNLVSKDSSWQCPVWIWQKPIKTIQGKSMQWRYIHTPIKTTLECEPI